MVNNYFDYNYLSSFKKSFKPSFIDVIKPRKVISSSLLSKESLLNFNNIINSAQKFIKVYDQAIPIIKQAQPLIGNIKTTFKVAKAFKSFSNESTLEKAFDNLPDFEEKNDTKDIKDKENDIGGTPFYPIN